MPPLCVHTHVLGSCRLSEGRTRPFPRAHGSLWLAARPSQRPNVQAEGCSASFPPPTLQSHPGFNRGILELEPETQAGDLSVALVWESPALQWLELLVHAKGLGLVTFQGTKDLQPPTAWRFRVCIWSLSVRLSVDV